MSSKKATSSAKSKSSGGSARKSAAKKSTASAKKKSGGSKTTRGTARKTSKRTLIEPRKGDKRYVRRDKKGEFKTEVNVGRSLAADRRRKSSKKVAKGQGDRGETTGGGLSGIVSSILNKF